MKIIKESSNSSAFFMLDGPDVIMASGPNSISVTRDAGNFINGPLSISSGLDSIKIGGIFRLNPLMATGLPSTMITPIPTLLIDIPLKGLASFSGVAALVGSLI